MRTTIILDQNLKNQARVKALYEGKTLTDIINILLKKYVTGTVSTAETNNTKYTDFSDLKTTSLKLNDKIIDRDFIYDLN